MKGSLFRGTLASITLAAVAVCGWVSPGMGATCLTNPADPVGNPVFGATVGTFTGPPLNIIPGNGAGGTTCIENGLWTTPSGFGLGSYIKGAESSGIGIDNTVLGSYTQPFPTGSADAANHLDHGWVQDTSPNANPLGAVGGAPSTGIVWDLGGQANQLAVFVFVDHGPVPGEVLENTAWLSNDPNAADAGWTQASLVHVYGAGWEDDPTISDGFVAVYQLAGGATFRYASVTWGGPGAIVRDGDNEIDAVGGLTEGGTGVIPEPSALALVGVGLAGFFTIRRRRKAQHA